MSNNLLNVLLGLLAGVWIFVIALLIFSIVVKWKLFEKAGKPGWASIIPFYNMIVLFEIIGYKWYYIFLLFVGAVPVVGYVCLVIFTISYNIKLAKSFDQATGFGIGLWLLNPIFTAILALSKDINYVGPAVNGDIDFDDLF